MDLRNFLSSLDKKGQARFATLCNTSVGHLRNVACGLRQCSAKLAVLAEQHSKEAVTRPELRPDWAEIWPELARRKKKSASHA